LRRIVDEFSKFARMPEPDRKSHDLTKLVQDAVMLQRLGQPNVEITLTVPKGAVVAELDDTMISQAMTNLIKNAGEAIDTLIEKKASDGLVPQVAVTMAVVEGQAHITIADNGIGLPEDRARLFEPYVTTRSEGTGLGLPIVKKIIEEHGGTLQLENAPIFAKNFGDQTHFGAMAVIKLPLAPTEIAAANNKKEV
jgi:two-component system nitrogen regulation sensor histidine kinase NtrY